MPRFQSILFDMDGTLVDTEQSCVQAIREVFLQYEVELSDEENQLIVGRRWDSVFDGLLRHYPKLKPHLAELDQKVRKKHLEGLQRGVPLIAGAVEAVEALASVYPLALVSGSTREEIALVLQSYQLERSFRFYLGAEDYRQSKPSPDGYLLALEKLGTQAHQTIIFEDSVAGIASGKAAGAKVIAVTSANHFGHSLDEADHQIKDFTSVNVDWIENLDWD